MALVLRKAVLPKNVSLLKCIKGRSLATAASKKNPAPLSAAVAGRSSKDEHKMRHVPHRKVEASPPLAAAPESAARRGSAPCRLSASCPELAAAGRARVPPRHLSPARAGPGLAPLASACLLRAAGAPGRAPSRAYGKACDCGCPCPFPCGPFGCGCGCGCLPPPCNTPPRCIQYMTGYYYYPYGVWFCGPYHVKACTPCGACGSCGACGPCGPCGPSCKGCACACAATVCPAAASLVPAAAGASSVAGVGSAAASVIPPANVFPPVLGDRRPCPSEPCPSYGDAAESRGTAPRQKSGESQSTGEPHSGVPAKPSLPTITCPVELSRSTGAGPAEASCPPFMKPIETPPVEMKSSPSEATSSKPPLPQPATAQPSRTGFSRFFPFGSSISLSHEMDHHPAGMSAKPPLPGVCPYSAPPARRVPQPMYSCAGEIASRGVHSLPERKVYSRTSIERHAPVRPAINVAQRRSFSAYALGDRGVRTSPLNLFSRPPALEMCPCYEGFESSPRNKFEPPVSDEASIADRLTSRVQSHVWNGAGWFRDRPLNAEELKPYDA